VERSRWFTGRAEKWFWFAKKIVMWRKGDTSRRMRGPRTSYISPTLKLRNYLFMYGETWEKKIHHHRAMWSRCSGKPFNNDCRTTVVRGGNAKGDGPK